MSTSNLLVVMTHGAADDVCRLFLPYWERSGAVILFSSPYDDRSRLDDVFHLHTGRAMTRERSSWWFYQARVLATMKAVLPLPFNQFVFTQYDSICLDELPSEAPGQPFGDTGLTIHNRVMAHVFGNNDPAYRARQFVHPPWCFDHKALVRFCYEARRHDIQRCEHGIMDRWMAWVLEEAGMEVEPANAWSWSANSIDTPELVADCRAAIGRGARFIHGVKNKHQLDAILL